MGLRKRVTDPVVVDWTIAAVLTAYAEFDTWFRGVVPGPVLVGAIGLAAMTVPLGLRRGWPLAVTVTSMVALAAESLAAGGAPEGGLVLLPVLLLLYTVAAYEPVDRALAGAGVVATAVVIQSIEDPQLAGVGDIVLVDGFFLGMLGSAAWSLGRYVRWRRRVETVLHDRAASLERASLDQAAILAAERGRIARELHDVVAHTVSVMGIQASAAAEVLERDPLRVRGALESIESTARDAVEELRRLLGVLRDDATTIEMGPQPGLGALERLVTGASGGGMTAELHVRGARRPLPAGLELAAYRIVQEALTNARKHAGTCQVTVVVDYGVDTLDLLVQDDGTGELGRGTGTGHGLIGMRERAEIYAGHLEAGPSEGGGYIVRARLPTRVGVR